MTEVVKLNETERAAAKALGYAIWKQGFKAANPEASDEARKAAWDEAKEAQIKAGKRALRAMQKAGFTVSKSDAA